MDELELRELIVEAKAGRVSRRDFTRRMVGLGLTPFATQLLAHAGLAQSPAPLTTNPPKQAATVPPKLLKLSPKATQSLECPSFRKVNTAANAIDRSRGVTPKLVEKITDLPVLLVATYRPEFQPPWVGQSQVTVIALNRLGRSEGATLVRRLAGNLAALPPDVVDEIVERTDGVPPFVGAEPFFSNLPP